MTKPKFASKMIIILAGYENDMNRLLSANEGLNSRFADEIVFPALSPKDSLLVLQNALKKENISIDCLKDISSHRPFLNMITELSVLPAWGNARDMITLAKSMILAVYQSAMDPISDNSKILLSYDEATACIQTMIDSKKGRAMVQGQPRSNYSTHDPVMEMPHKLRTSPEMNVNTVTSMKTNTRQKEEKQPSMEVIVPERFEDGVARDVGVSDAVWAQLQQDKRAIEEEARIYAEETRRKQKEIQALEEAEKKAREEAEREIEARNKAERQKQLRLREEARIRQLKAMAERKRIEQERKRLRLEEVKRRQKEKEAQAKLTKMGVCVAGFQWIKQEGGYRCAGGSHFVSDAQLRM